MRTGRSIGIQTPRLRLDGFGGLPPSRSGRGFPLGHREALRSVTEKRSRDTPGLKSPTRGPPKTSPRHGLRLPPRPPRPCAAVPGAISARVRIEPRDRGASGNAGGRGRSRAEATRAGGDSPPPPASVGCAEIAIGTAEPSATPRSPDRASRGGASSPTAAEPSALPAESRPERGPSSTSHRTQNQGPARSGTGNAPLRSSAPSYDSRRSKAPKRAPRCATIAA